MTTKRKSNIPDTVAEAAVMLQQAYEEKVQEQAQAHLDDSIETLAELSKGKDAEGEAVETTPAARRGAANDLIAHGFARDAGGQPDAGGGGSGGGGKGINIQIISYGGMPDVRVEHDITPEHRKISEETDEPDDRGDGDSIHISRAEGRPAEAVRGAPRSGQAAGDDDRELRHREPGAVSRAYQP